VRVSVYRKNMPRSIYLHIDIHTESSGMVFDCDMQSGIYSDMYFHLFDQLSEINSDTCIFWHLLGHAFWNIFWHFSWHTLQHQFLLAYALRHVVWNLYMLANNCLASFLTENLTCIPTCLLVCICIYIYTHGLTSILAFLLIYTLTCNYSGICSELNALACGLTCIRICFWQNFWHVLTFSHTYPGIFFRCISTSVLMGVRSCGAQPASPWEEKPPGKEEEVSGLLPNTPNSIRGNG
jgi:hypothetical protein